jgi:hypothetical protein
MRLLLDTSAVLDLAAGTLSSAAADAGRYPVSTIW